MDRVEFENLATSVVDEVASVSTMVTGAHARKTFSIENEFFMILQTEPKTAFLADPFGEGPAKSSTTKKFYKLLSGDKTSDKTAVLNNCMILFVTKNLHRKDGKPMQPNSVMTKLKTLFGVFKRKGIQYSLKTDFKYAGGFAAYLSKFWNDQHGNDPTFGARPNKFALPESYGMEIRRAVLEGCMDASGKDASDLLYLFAFSLGTMFGFRGNKVRFFVFVMCENCCCYYEN